MEENMQNKNHKFSADTLIPPVIRLVMCEFIALLAGHTSPMFTFFACPFVRALFGSDTAVEIFSDVTKGLFGAAAFIIAFYITFCAQNGECKSFHKENPDTDIRGHISKFGYGIIPAALIFALVFVIFARELSFEAICSPAFFAQILTLFRQSPPQYPVYVTVCAALLWLLCVSLLYFVCLKLALAKWRKNGFADEKQPSVKKLASYIGTVMNIFFFIHVVSIYIASTLESESTEILLGNTGWSMMIMSLLCVTACFIAYFAEAIIIIFEKRRVLGSVMLALTVFGAVLFLGEAFYSVEGTVLCTAYLAAYFIFRIAVKVRDKIKAG